MALPPIGCRGLRLFSHGRRRLLWRLLRRPCHHLSWGLLPSLLPFDDRSPGCCGRRRRCLSWRLLGDHRLLLLLLLPLAGVLLLLLLLLLLGVLLLLLLLLPLGVLLLFLLPLLGVLLLLLLLLPLGVLLLFLLLLPLGVLLLLLLLLPLGILLLLLLLLPLGVLLLLLLLLFLDLLLLFCRCCRGRLLLLTGYGGLRHGIRLRRTL